MFFKKICMTNWCKMLMSLIVIDTSKLVSKTEYNGTIK